MASIRKRGQRWQSQVRKKGVKPLSKSFRTKREARVWAYTIESEIERGIFMDRTLAENTLVKDVLKRYETEIAPKTKREKRIISCLKNLYLHFGAVSLANIKSKHLSEFRELRLQTVKPQTVIHELRLILRILSISQQEWGIHLPHGLPNIAMPKNASGRTRRLEEGEYEKLLTALHETPIMQKIVPFAIETAMRRGEICNMKWEHINRNKRILHIPETKTDTPRTIPLSSLAISILDALPRRIDGYVFGLKPDSITQAFNRACKRENVENLRLHDLRHEATSRLFEKGLNIVEVMTITGHKDPKMLYSYTHIKPAKILDKLSQ